MTIDGRLVLFYDYESDIGDGLADPTFITIRREAERHEDGVNLMVCALALRDF